VIRSPRDDPRGTATERMEKVHGLACRMAVACFHHEWAVVRDLHEQMGVLLAPADGTGGVQR
jgi:hypothetical protein